ncbi:MAG: FliG C-terminal domain-containing protein [Elusimicrobiota bacterium]
MAKNTVKFKLAVCLLLLLCTSSLQLLKSQLLQEQPDLELTRRENAVSDRIQSQIEELLNNYYKKGSFIVNVKSHLERIPIKEKSAKTGESAGGGIYDEEEVALPGLPVSPSVSGSGEVDRFIIDQWVFSDRFKIKYIELTVLLDEKIFLAKDIEFVKTIVKTRAGLDETRGDTLTVKVLSFPPPVESAGIVKEEIPAKEPKSPITEIYPYLYFGGTVLALLLFVIILLQVINIIKTKKAAEGMFPHPSYGLRLPPLPMRSQMDTARLPPLPEGTTPSEKQPLELPLGTKSEPSSLSQDRKDIFYELRQLMVTTLIGNPELASEIFKRWVEVDKEGGIYQIAGFLKATDPKLIELLSEHLGQDIASKVEFAMNQMVSIDKEGLIETFKKFREEYQKEQSVKAEKTGSGQADMFQFLKQLTPEQIFHIIKDEPVSIIAIVLAQVPPEITNSILKDLPSEKQLKLPVEMGKLKKIPVSAYSDIADKLARKALEVEKIKYVTTDGIDALVNILDNSSPEKEQEILTTIAEHDISLAEELRKIYITFDQLVRLPDKVLSEILRGIDRDIITKSLTNSTPELKNKLLNNLPTRTKIIVSDGLKALEEAGEISVDEVQAARRLITQKIRELAKLGKIDFKKCFIEN